MTNLQAVKLPTKDDNGFGKSERELLITIFENGIDRIDGVHNLAKGKTRNRLMFEYLCGVHKTFVATNHPLADYFTRLMVFVFQVRDPYEESKAMIKMHKEAIEQ